MFDIKNVFQVDGIVAVITGGGTGKFPSFPKMIYNLSHYRQELDG